MGQDLGAGRSFVRIVEILVAEVRFTHAADAAVSKTAELKCSQLDDLKRFVFGKGTGTIVAGAVGDGLFHQLQGSVFQA